MCFHYLYVYLLPCGEPVGMHSHGVRSTVCLIMPQEILFQPIKDVLLVHVGEDTLVKVGTMAGNESFYMVGVQRDLPHSRKLSSWAGLGFALVGMAKSMV